MGKIKSASFAAAAVSILCMMLLPLQGSSQTPLQRRIPLPRAGPSDVPQVREFTITPAAVVRGSPAVIRWRVEPGVGGSPIRSLTVARVDGTGPVVNITSSDLNGEFNLSIPATAPEGTSIYALTAVNELYRTSTAVASLRVTGPPDLTVDNIESLGLSVAFSIKNVGTGDFRGRLTLRVSVNDRPGEIRIDRFGGIVKIADGVYEAGDAAIAPGNSKSYGLLDPESHEPGWYSGTYRISVRVESNHPSDPAANNEKRVTLNHTGLRRGKPELDLYFLGDITLLNYDAWASADLLGIRFKIMNTGPAAASNIEWEARIYENEHLLRGESGWRLKSGTVASLAPGNTEVTFDFHKPDLAGRAILLRIILDPKDRIFESEEGNNQKDIAIRIPARMVE